MAPPIRAEFLRGTLAHIPLPAKILIVTSFCLGPILLFIAFELIGRRGQRDSIPGCRRLGIRIKSQLSDQYNDSRYFRSYTHPNNDTKAQSGSGGTDAQGLPNWRVKALFVYPIKSCAGIELYRSEIVRTGLRYDRMFCLAKSDQKEPVIRGGPHDGEKEKDEKEHVWTFLTQRSTPKLSQLKTEIWTPADDATPKIIHYRTGGVMRVSFPKPDHEQPGILQRVKYSLGLLSKDPTRLSFTVPINPLESQVDKYGLKPERFDIWTSKTHGMNMTPLIPPKVLSSLRVYLEVDGSPSTELALIRESGREEFRRHVYPNAPGPEELGYQPVVAFADSSPMQIVNLASIRGVANHELIPKSFGKLDAIRFRSNCYITGPPPFHEDNWRAFRAVHRKFPDARADIDHILHLRATNRTTRCNLPNVDPSNGQVPKRGSPNFNQPRATLNQFRAIDKGTAGGKNQPCLGMMMVLTGREKEGHVQAGEEELWAHGFRNAEDPIYISVGDEIVLDSCGEHAKMADDRKY